MTRPRLGVVTTSYPREAGDPAGGFVAGFARWLVGEGCAVEVIAAGPGAREIDAIPILRLDGRGLFYTGGAPDLLARGGGRSWLAAARFQTALAIAVAGRVAAWQGAISHWVIPSGLATALTLPGGRPHLAIAHSSDIALLRRHRAGLAALRWLSRRADLVYTGRHLVAPGAPGRIVPMGIDPVPPGHRARGRARFALRGTTALFLGRLVPIKGVELLLDALPEGLDLVIAGEGPLRPALSERAAASHPRVRLLGEVRGEAKQDLLAAVDLLVVPSLRLGDGRQEGAPTVLFEGLAAGLPIVATESGGIVDALGEAGWVVAPTRAALHEALRRLRDDEALRRGLATAASAAAAGHTWSVVGPRLAGRLLDQVRSPLHAA